MAQWIEILSSQQTKLQNLGAELKIHPLVIEDCLHRDQMAKLDDYDSHQLLVWFAVIESKIYELQFVILKDQIVVVPHEAPPKGETWREYLQLDLKIMEQELAWPVMYLALDRLLDLTWQDLKNVSLHVDNFEQKVFKKSFNPQILFSFKKQLNRYDYSLQNLSAVVQKIMNFKTISGEWIWKWRDLFDHTERIHRALSLYKSQVVTTIELYWGWHANKTNQQIKKLSLLASVFVPLTFWTSFWGMNFESIPFSSEQLFYLAVVIMIVSLLITATLLVKKGYWSEK